MKIGIIAAVPDEIKTIHDDINFRKLVNHAERKFYLGNYNNLDLTLVISNVGKVSSTITAVSLIEKFNVDMIIFTGLAGAVSKKLNIGDIVLCDKTYQHDVDARPLCKNQFEIPPTGRDVFKFKNLEIQRAKMAINNFIEKLDDYIKIDHLKELNLNRPKLHIGTIASGDQFIQNVTGQPNLHIEKLDTLAVEMEGAAVAQVCAEYNIPYTLIRTICDEANESAFDCLNDFSRNIASRYASGMIQELLKIISDENS